jgi:hypothetical protein
VTFYEYLLEELLKMAGNWRETGSRTGNNRTMTQDWEQQNKNSVLGTTEQGLRTWNNRTRAQDWEQQIKGLGLGKTEEGFRPGNNRLKT